MVYHDANVNAVRDGTPLEPLLGGALITVTNSINVTVGTYTTTGTETSPGHCWSNLPGGQQYWVTEKNPSQYPASTTSDLVSIPSLPPYPPSTNVEFGDAVCTAVPGPIDNNTPTWYIDPQGQKHVTLTWTLTSPSADAFAIYRQIPGETDFTLQATVGGLTWTDPIKIDHGEEWSYYIIPINHCGNGPTSNTVIAGW